MLKVKRMISKDEYSPVDKMKTTIYPLREWAIVESDGGYDRPILWIEDNIKDPKSIGNGIIAALDKSGIKLIIE